MKKRVSYILAFVLMLTLMSLSLIIGAKCSMFSMRGITNACQKTQYYRELQKEIVEQAYYAGIPYGIEKSCIEDAFSEEKIKEDFEKVLAAQLKDEKTLIRTIEIEDKIRANVIDTYGELNEKKEQALNQYIVEVDNIYQEKITFPDNEDISQLVNISTKAVVIGVPICIIAIIIIIAVLVGMRKIAHHGFEYVVYGTFGAGFSLILISIVTILRGFTWGYDILGERINNFLTFYLKQGIYTQIMFGAFYIMIGLIILMIILRSRARYKHHRHHRHHSHHEHQE